MRIFALAVSIVLLTHAAVAGASWSTPVRVSPMGAGAAAPFVGFGADGVEQVGWACDGPFRGRCRAGSRAGFARGPFDAPVTAAVPHVAEAGAVDPRGGVWLMGAVDKADGDRMEAVHIDGRGRVVERSYISPRGANARHPSLAVDARGDVLAAWEQDGRVEAAWRRHGRAWRLHDASRGRLGQSPAVALNDSAAGIVAFRSGRSVRVADLGAHGWGYPRAVGPAGDAIFVPVAVAMARSGAAAVTWEQGLPAGESGEPGPEAVLVARRAAREPFSDRRTTVLDRRPSTSGRPVVAVADDGATLVGWIGGAGPTLAYAPAAGDFAAPVEIVHEYALRIAVALGGGRAYAAWTDGSTLEATDGPAGGEVAAPQRGVGGSLLRLALAANERGAVLAALGGSDVFVARDVSPAAR